MNKILGMDSAYTSAVEKRGRDMVISASLVSEMVDRIRELELTEKAFIAAKGFIDSHAADPDITEEMCLAYSEYLDAIGVLNLNGITPA